MSKRRAAGRFTEDGLPVSALDWTEADWQDLHEAMEAVKRKVGKRHASDKDRPGIRGRDVDGQERQCV